MGLVFATFGQYVLNLHDVQYAKVGVDGAVQITLRDDPMPLVLGAGTLAAETAEVFFSIDRFVSGQQGFRVIVNPDGLAGTAAADEQAGEASATGG